MIIKFALLIKKHQNIIKSATETRLGYKVEMKDGTIYNSGNLYFIERKLNQHV